jgi:hypothetical protein
MLARIRARRLELGERCQSLWRIRDGAEQRLKVNAEDELAWEALAFFYRRWPSTAAELAVLDYSSVPDRITFIGLGEAERRQRLELVVSARGFRDSDGRWVEVPQ